MDATSIPLTRADLRKAISSHPQWDTIKTDRGWKIETMTMEDLRKAGIILSIPGAATATAGNVENAAVTATKTADVNLFGEATATPSVKDKDKAKAAIGLMAAIEAIAGQAMDRDAVLAMVKAEVKAAMADAPVTRIEVRRQDGTTAEVKGHKHPMFADLLTVLSARDVRGYPINVWIAGPAGSGKTHAAHQAAEALGLNFYLQGAMSMPHELVGFVDAGGRYHDTPFVRAFRDGGVILLDELDAGDNSALLALNAALANGSMSLPTAEHVKRHASCVIIGAANTFGLGATADYIGRTKIDAAFLSRFPVKLSWTYDDRLEQDISGNAAWAKTVQAARAKAVKAGLKVIIDPRHSIAGAALLAQGMDEKRVRELTYLSNLTANQRRMIEGT